MPQPMAASEELGFFRKMKDTNYINIQGWMINKLKLKGNELILFAIIYGFSQDEESLYNGSLSYIGKAMGISRKSVINLITKLQEKNFIIKYLGIETNKYQHNAEEVERIMDGGEIITLGKNVPPNGEQTSLLPGEESSHNNNTFKNDTNIDFDKLLGFLNSRTGKRARVVPKSVRQKYRARLKEGYTKSDIVNAINNAVANKYHNETGYRFLTIEFFSRSQSLSKWGFSSSTATKPQEQENENKEPMSVKDARDSGVHVNF